MYIVDAIEAQRLAVLRSLRILDSLPEPEYEHICQAAAEQLNAPVAAITFVDKDRQWCKATTSNALDIPRNESVCTYAILSDHLFEIENLAADPRFARNALVAGHPGFRFYAGAPIVFGSGVRLGTVCVLDVEPRRLTDDERSVLIELADRVAGELWAASPSVDPLEFA